jgi:hypothetical protein
MSKVNMRHFAAGSLAAAGLFAVYYLRNSDSVSGYLDRHGASAWLLGAVSLAIVAVLTGLWTSANKPKDVKAAVSIGLGVPGLLFGLDLGGSGSKPEAETTAHASVVPIAGLLDDSPLGAGLALVFQPVEVVRERAKEEVQEVAETAFKVQMTASLEALHRELQPVVARVNANPAIAPAAKEEIKTELTAAQARQQALIRNTSLFKRSLVRGPIVAPPR